MSGSHWQERFPGDGVTLFQHLWGRKPQLGMGHRSVWVGGHWGPLSGCTSAAPSAHQPQPQVPTGRGRWVQSAHTHSWCWDPIQPLHPKLGKSRHVPGCSGHSPLAFTDGPRGQGL